MSNENYKEILNNEVLDNLHKIIRLMRSQYPMTKNEDGTTKYNVDFMNEAYLLNNSVQQFIALQINLYSKYNNIIVADDTPIATIEPTTPVIEPTIIEPTNTPTKPKKKRNRKKKTNIAIVENIGESETTDIDISTVEAPMFERVTVGYEI